MKLSQAATIWIDYHKTHSKKNTVRAYRAIIERIIQEFGEGPVVQATPEQILTFLNRLMVIKSGKPVGVKRRPHGLPRHSATYASRSGAPIEIISRGSSGMQTCQRHNGIWGP